MEIGSFTYVVSFVVYQLIMSVLWNYKLFIVISMGAKNPWLVGPDCKFGYFNIFFLTQMSLCSGLCLSQNPLCTNKTHRLLCSSECTQSSSVHRLRLFTSWSNETLVVSPKADAIRVCDTTGMWGINYLSVCVCSDPEHKHVVCARLLFLVYFRFHGCLWHSGK